MEDLFLRLVITVIIVAPAVYFIVAECASARRMRK